MGCKINALSISKLLSSLTEYLDSKYRGRLYNITNFQVQAGCKELDNFLSSIHKVQLTTKVFTVGSESFNGAEVDGVGENTKIRKCSEEHQFNLICKSTILEDDGNRDNLEKYYWSILFTKEKICYDFLENLAQELGEVSPLCPKMHHCYSEGEEEYFCLIMDDLSIGFTNPLDHGEGISLQECNLIMKSLARLHALSLVLEGKQGCTLPSKYEICTTELLFSAGVEPALKPLTYNSFLGFLKLTANFRPDLLPYLKRIDDDENIWNRLCDLVKPGRTSFSCLCHGDPRSSNIFLEKSTSQKPSCRENNGKSSNHHDYHHHDGSNFKPEEKNVENGMSVNGGGESQIQSLLLQEPGLRFIDFQLTRYASPVTDLQYVLHMNTTRDFREKHTMEVLRTYYAEFQDVLGRFPHVILEQSEGVRGWTFEKLTEEYEKFYMYGFLAAVILLPIVLLRPVDMDIDKSMSQMTKAERTQFFKDGRADLVFNAGSRNDNMRKRLFEMCDEMVAKNVIPTNAPA